MKRMFSLSNVKRKVLAGLTTALLVFGSVGIGEAQLYNPTSDFSINNGNPNGVWSYGWMPIDFSTFNLYTSYRFYEPESSSTWYRTGSPYYTPNILRNDGSITINGVAPGQLALHPSITNEPSVLRWTAPSGGMYNIDGQFFSGDVGITQVSIRQGSNWLWQGTDSGIFNFDVSVASGESVDFLVWGGYVGGSTPLELRISPVSKISAIADFDGDGKSDILWRHTDGTIAIWFMNGTTVLPASGGVAMVPNDWQIKGIGDFNGDTKADILWRHTDGTIAIWFMNGTTVLPASGGVAMVPNDWQIKGIGDFNGDTKADILWQHTDGTVAIWFMYGTTVFPSSGGVTGAPNWWQIKSIDDFNGDGKSDILWRHWDGTLAIWFMYGTFILPSSGGVAMVPNDWQIKP